MRNNHSVIKFFSSHLLVQSGSMSRCFACLLPLGWYICSYSRPTDKYTNEWRKCLFFLHTNGIHLATLESSTHNISFWEHPKMINYASASSSSCWWWWWRPLRIDDLRMNSRGSAPHAVSIPSTLVCAASVLESHGSPFSTILYSSLQFSTVVGKNIIVAVSRISRKTKWGLAVQDGRCCLHPWWYCLRFSTLTASSFYKHRLKKRHYNCQRSNPEPD